MEHKDYKELKEDLIEDIKKEYHILSKKRLLALVLPWQLHSQSQSPRVFSSRKTWPQMH